MLQVTSLTTHHVRLPFRTPIKTGTRDEHGVPLTYTSRLLLFVSVETADGIVGWGECGALEDKAYFHENVAEATSNVRQIARRIVGRDDVDPMTFATRGDTPMATSAVEQALLDAMLVERGGSLAELFGIETEWVPVTMDFGVHDSVAELVEKVEAVRGQARLIKLKIQPGWDLEPARAVRELGFDVMVDANGAYGPEQMSLLEGFRDLGALVEQPFARDDLQSPVELRRRGVRVSLDESVDHVDDPMRLVDMGAADVLGVKWQRFGGIVLLRQFQMTCAVAGVSTRVGNMYPSAHAAVVDRVMAAGTPVASAVKPYASTFSTDFLPADTVKDGCVHVPRGTGAGIRLDDASVAKFAIDLSL
jgi:o-succinylbenzoate synthase